MSIENDIDRFISSLLLIAVCFITVFSGRAVCAGWGQPEFIDLGWEYFCRDPKVVMDDYGNAFCSFFINDPYTGTPHIYVNRYEGSCWGAPELLNPGEGFCTEMGDISEDPLFVSPGSPDEDYHLQSGSPCIDMGIDDGAPSKDFEGNSRLVDIPGVGHEETDTTDMGAYEYQATKIPVIQKERSRFPVKVRREKIGDSPKIEALPK